MAKLAECIVAAKNATKGNASTLTNLVLEFRGNKTKPTKIMNDGKKDLVKFVDSTAYETDSAIDSIVERGERLKAELSAAVDCEVVRAITLRKIPKGTTGKGKLNYSDVVSEVLGVSSRSTAVENNDRCLQAAGLI